MNYNGRTILSFESRRAAIMENMIRKFNGTPLIAPSLKEVSLGEQPDIFQFTEELLNGKIDGLIFTTGVGTAYLFDSMALKYNLKEVTEKISSLRVIARGPKPAKVLREHNIDIDVIAPEPNTYKEMLASIDATKGAFDLSGKTIALQEYGVTNPEMVDGLKKRGAAVRQVTVYRWELPDDTGPLERAVDAVIDGGVDMALFTSGIQISHVLEVARQMKKEDAFRQALSLVTVCSIGPVCTKGLEASGVKVDFIPSHPKQGHLVSESAKMSDQLCKA